MIFHKNRKIARHVQKTALKIIIKTAKATSFFTVSLPNFEREAVSKFYLSTAFGLSLIIRSTAYTRSSTSYTHILITKIGNRNLKQRII